MQKYRQNPDLEPYVKAVVLCHALFMTNILPTQLYGQRKAMANQYLKSFTNSSFLSSARCVDAFHVVEWAMTALDEVRKDSSFVLI